MNCRTKKVQNLGLLDSPLALLNLYLKNPPETCSFPCFVVALFFIIYQNIYEHFPSCWEEEEEEIAARWILGAFCEVPGDTHTPY